MSLKIDDVWILRTVQTWGWKVTDYTEEEKRIEQYDYEGWRYTLIYRMLQSHWTTPCGSSVPCKGKIEVLDELRREKINVYFV